MLGFYARAIPGAGIAFVIALLLAMVILPVRANGPFGVPAVSPAGWHSRATPHPDGAAYEIKKDNLVFGMTRTSLAEASGELCRHNSPNMIS